LMSRLAGVHHSFLTLTPWIQKVRLLIFRLISFWLD
jgi:hypothetical protein